MKVNPIYKLIFIYHANMIELCNIQQSLGLISDEKAEESNKKHTMGCLKSAHFGGFSTPEAEELFKKY